jgi:hypothetical protein
MARIAGRSGRLYANLTSAGTAEPIAFLTNWSLQATTNKIKVTAFGDTNEVYVGGLPDAQGSLSGWYDNATVQLYTAATDGVARKMYLYPDNSLATQYFWGTAIFDFSVDIGVDGAAAITGSWAAATPILKQG